MNEEYSRSEYQIRGNKFSVKAAAKMTESKIIRDQREAETARINRERIEKNGNSRDYINLGSDDRFSGKIYNNTGITENEKKSYYTGYYKNGEKRISAMLDKMTPEECQKYGAFEYSLGISLTELELLKKNTSYMTGYTIAVILNSGEQNTKHR